MDIHEQTLDDLLNSHSTATSHGLSDRGAAKHAIKSIAYCIDVLNAINEDVCDDCKERTNFSIEAQASIIGLAFKVLGRTLNHHNTIPINNKLESSNNLYLKTKLYEAFINLGYIELDDNKGVFFHPNKCPININIMNNFTQIIGEVYKAGYNDAIFKIQDSLGIIKQ